MPLPAFYRRGMAPRFRVHSVIDAGVVATFFLEHFAEQDGDLRRANRQHFGRKRVAIRGTGYGGGLREEAVSHTRPKQRLRRMSGELT